MKALIADLIRQVNVRLTSPGLSAPTKKRLNQLKVALQTAYEQQL